MVQLSLNLGHVYLNIFLFFMHLTFFPYNKALSFCLNIYNFCTTVSSNPDRAGPGRLQGGKQEQGGALPGAPEKPGQGTMTFSPSLSLSLSL